MICFYDIKELNDRRKKELHTYLEESLPEKNFPQLA